MIDNKLKKIRINSNLDRWHIAKLIRTIQRYFQIWESNRSIINKIQTLNLFNTLNITYNFAHKIDSYYEPAMINLDN